MQADARRALVKLARDHGVLPVAVVLDVPVRLCLERNGQRVDRRLDERVIRWQLDQLRRSLKSLRREGFRKIYVLTSEVEIAEARFRREPLLNDFTADTGPFGVIGDVHGCLGELSSLLDTLGYTIVGAGRGRAVDASHPMGCRAVFVW